MAKDKVSAPSEPPTDAVMVVYDSGDLRVQVAAGATLPPDVWPTLLRRAAQMLERKLLDG